MPDLIAPSPLFEASYRLADRERDRAASAASFAALLRDLAADTTTTELWLVDGDTYIGKVRIRHSLDGPLDWRGHLGVTIRPSQRRMGHATRLVQLALPHAHVLGIDPAVLSCEPHNLASRRLIARLGATFLDEVEGATDHPAMLRFRLPTGDRPHRR